MIYIYYNDDTFADIAKAVHFSLSQKYPPNPTPVVQLITEIDQNNATVDNLFIMLGLNNETPIIPPKFIAYQFEQTGNKNSWFTENYLSKLRSAIEIWDYSIVNIQNLRKTYTDLPNIRYVPLGYSPTLQLITDIKPSDQKKYDILFYGSANPRRDAIIRNLRHNGFRVYYGEFSCWDEDRNRLIADSKIVLNLHYFPNPILETTRISFLVANGAFVITEPSLDPILDREYKNYAVFSDADNLVKTCQNYLENLDARDAFAQQAQLKFSQKEYIIPTEVINQHLNPPSSSPASSPSSSPSPSPSLSTTQSTLTKLTQQKPPTTQPTKSNKKSSVSLSTPTRSQTPLQSITSKPNIPQEAKGKIRPKFNIADVEITHDGAAILKLDNTMTPENCPKVSLVTPSSNRTWALTTLAVRNFYKFDYPREKLEWIIVDSQISDKTPVFLPQDPRIKYHIVDHKIPLWEKRNMCNKLATGEVIIHLDDDDYYFPTSIWAKVKLLSKYRLESQPHIQCVGCTQLGIYHLIDNYSYLADTKYISEASMAYTKQFWESRPFNADNLEMGEGYSFIQSREKEVATLPYYFNLIALTHNQNYTGKLRTYKDTTGKKHDNFFNLWDKDTQYFFLELKQKAIKSKK